MCDDQTNKDAEEYLKQQGLTRRAFNKATGAAAAAWWLPGVAAAADVVEEDVMVPTPDGQADCYLAHPESGAHASVIVWPDVMGIRPSFRSMGKRLAQAGYTALVVNPYYRTHKGRLMPEGKGFGDPGIRDMLMPHARSLSPETCVTDGRAFVEYLDAHPAGDASRKVGTTGYCMTGSYVLRLAAAIPDRIGAGASFHGGGLATDKADSPHLLIPQMDDDVGFLIAIAENDDERFPQEKTRLKESFSAAFIGAEVEVYEGAQHGWCPPDSQVYNEAQAERAWSRMLALFERKLA